MGFFSSNAFSQSQIEIDQQVAEKNKMESENNVAEMPFDPSILQKIQQSLSEMEKKDDKQIKALSIVYSENPNDFNMFLGTTYSFEYTILTVNRDLIPRHFKEFFPSQFQD